MGQKLRYFLQISDCLQGCMSTVRLSVGSGIQEKTGLNKKIKNT